MAKAPKPQPTLPKLNCKHAESVSMRGLVVCLNLELAQNTTHFVQKRRGETYITTIAMCKKCTHKEIKS